ncbi:acetyl-CoA synthetase-like protein [Dendrothele bispora CBS 962.96]|uniref:Acetyl-CoA synthetase-like protein n=1 Tax=Dendrothele bispora (strain CBS 962.96) TaxID=1314807 RepID=A0A4S8LS63_DENBC|nr:acetyl-CoA synthetase-like protein [Dendrothele bispora CBS 962.96]
MDLLPPLTGELYLPDFIDFHLQRNGHKPAYVFAYGVDECVTISFAQLGRAVHRGAVYLKNTIEARGGETLALIASVDSILYVTVVLATIKAGYVPFMISPRNSPAAITSMLAKIGCTHVLKQSNSTLDQLLLNSIQSETLVFHEIPTLQRLYGPDRLGLADDFVPYSSPNERTPEDIAFIIHSSGSTGFPKPVPQKFVTILHWMNFRESLKSLLNHPTITLCGAMGLPGFHAFGVNFQLLYPLTLSKPTSLFPPTSYDFRTDVSPIFPSPVNILQHIIWTRSDVLMTVPSFVTMWRNDPHCVEILKSLKAVCCSSGPLPQNVGDDLIKWGVPLCTSYGATEFGIPTYRIALDESGNTSLDALKNISVRLQDWRYVGFNKHVQTNLVPVGIEGGYELQIMTWKNHQPAIENIEEGSPGYATHDIVQVHPTKPFLWRLVGRTDEVIVLSSGEKVVPNVMENELGSCPLLSGVLMFGRGRLHCGLLVEAREPKETDGWAESLVDTIWPLVEKVNSTYPNFGRITREMIVVIPFNSLAVRVDKGGIARAATLQLFEKQIDKAYQEFENDLSVTAPLTWTEEEVRDWLQKQIVDLIPSGPALSSRVTSNVDIFTLGFDSVSAVSLRARIKNALDKDASGAGTVSPTLVYDFPTIDGLANVIAEMMSNPSTNKKEEIDSGVPSRHLDLIRALTAKHSICNPSLHTYPSPLKLRVGHGDTGRVVLLTGSTGSLGSYILWKLLEDVTVTRIFAVNRPSSTSSSLNRQQKSFREKGISVDTRLLEAKVTFIEGDAVTSSPIWISEVDVVIHNAWQVDFNLSLSSFEPLIQSTRCLIETILQESSRRVIQDQRARPIRFIFISSTSAAQNWDQTRGPVEEIVVDPKYAVGKGYGESKHVVEAILKSCPDGFDYTCLRIGQLCGGKSPNGYWAPNDWVPAMIKSSVAIGALPGSHGVAPLDLNLCLNQKKKTVSWISLQDASKTILEIAFSSSTDPHSLPPIINLVHPSSAKWDSIVHIAAKSLNQKEITKTLLPTVPFCDWIARLRSLEECQSSPNVIDVKTPEAKKDLASVCPALKILPFFTAFAMQDTTQLNHPSDPSEAGGKPKYLVSHAIRLSETMRGLRRTRNDTSRDILEYVDEWIDFWKEVGFLKAVYSTQLDTTSDEV